MELTQDPQNEVEMLKKMEDEHLRLQRQVRMIQTDRQNSTLGVHPQFRRQDKLLRILKKDYLNLIKDLKVARSGAHKKKDKKMKAELRTALLDIEMIEQECDSRVTLMAQIDELLHRKNKQMLVLKKAVSANAGQLEERRHLSEQRLVSTENQLEAAILRFNKVQFENQTIREEIEHMLKDRMIFNQAWAKMMSILNRGKKFMIDLFESSTWAYDQRDEWVSKLKSVQEKAKMDQSQQLQEMRDLQKAFDHEVKQYKFLAKKGVRRVNKQQEMREAEKITKENEELAGELKKHINIINDIISYTKEFHPSKIIENFKKKEAENFSIYKLLTHYSAENISLKKDLDMKLASVLDLRERNEAREEKAQAKIEKLREKVEEKKMFVEEMRRKVAMKDEFLNSQMKQIEEMFRMVECSLEPFENLLGDKQPSLHQLMLTMRLISMKITEYLEVVCYYERNVQKKDLAPSLEPRSRLKKLTVQLQTPSCWTAYSINMLVPADPCPACVEGRWMCRVSDTLEAPLDRERALAAVRELSLDPAFLRSDRIHPLTECRVPRSRLLLASRFTQQ